MNARDPQPPAHAQWEYQIDRVGFVGISHSVEAFNEDGAAGWEICGVVTDGTQIVVVWKRPR